MLCEAIERQLFMSTKRLVNGRYKKSVRNLVFALKHQDRVRGKVLNGKYTPEKIVNKYIEET